MVSGVALPGMAATVAGSRLLTHRAAPNVWWLSLTDAPTVMADALRDLRPTSLPSEALAVLQQAVQPADDPPAVNAMVAKVELDVCGAWLTVANACAARPVALRRAGWVDLRGHPSSALGSHPPYEPTDDRVGLGPGDVLVLRLGPEVTTGDAVDDDLIDACLKLAGGSTDAIADTVRARVGGQVAAVGVPADLGEDPLSRVARATGVPPQEVQTPGYPLGDLQPDLWKQPPRPPRLARLRLSADRSSVASVRSLLDRLLTSWRLDGRLDPDDVKLVATELAANAVVHSGEPDTVTVRYLGPAVRVEVIDRSTRRPVPRAATVDAIGGRGLLLIEALGSAWGSEQTEVGKRVWCDIAVVGGNVA